MEMQWISKQRNLLLVDLHSFLSFGQAKVSRRVFGSYLHKNSSCPRPCLNAKPHKTVACCPFSHPLGYELLQSRATPNSSKRAYISNVQHVENRIVFMCFVVNRCVAIVTLTDGIVPWQPQPEYKVGESMD